MFNNVPPNGFPQIPDIEDLEAVKNSVAELQSTKANKAGIAPAFSAEGNYSVGDLVYYEGTLYKCTTAHETAAWDAEDFTETTIDAEIAAVNGDVSDLQSTKANQITIAPAFSAETAYSAGDIVYYNGLTYRCTNDHEGAWDASDFAATTVANELGTLMSGLSNLVKSATFTVRTDTSGNVKLTTDYIKIVGIYAYPTLSQGVMCRVRSFWVNNPAPETYPYNGTYIEVTTMADAYEHVKETEVTGMYYYI